MRDDDIGAAVTAYRATGSKRGAANRLGWSRSKVRRHLERAAERGLLGPAATLPGYVIKSLSETPAGTYVKQVKAHGEKWAAPEGHQVRGVSALVDAEGRVVQQWLKTSKEAEERQAFELAIHEAFDRHVGYSTLPPKPAFVDADLLTVYPIVDLHLGLFSWGKETGADYDLDIASDLLKRSIDTLVSRAAPSETAIILDLGDYVHTDSSRNQTGRSGNPLDVDSRYARVCRIGVELAVHCIELALQKHRQVIYRKLPGNHDDETSLMLAVALAAWFRNEPRVEVDTNPGRFYELRHGKVMIAATHGDMLRMSDMPGFMAANWPQDWGASEFRYGLTGHVHHDRVKFAGGVRAESFNTLAAQDAWAKGMGFTSQRTAVAITFHKDFGETDRLTVSLPMLSTMAEAA